MVGGGFPPRPERPMTEPFPPSESPAPSAGTPGDVTRLLSAMDQGDGEAQERIVQVLYDQLHDLAEAVMRSERADHTLSPTALVHEAYIRLADARRVGWNDRGHFMAVACRVMRRVLVDHARRRSSAKRDGGARVTLNGAALEIEPDRALEILALDEALGRLETLDARRARVVEMRFFSGLEVDEVARSLGVSEATVKRDWRFARAWLLAELGESSAA